MQGREGRSEGGRPARSPTFSSRREAGRGPRGVGETTCFQVAWAPVRSQRKVWLASEAAGGDGEMTLPEDTSKPAGDKSSVDGSTLCPTAYSLFWRSYRKVQCLQFTEIFLNRVRRIARFFQPCACVHVCACACVCRVCAFVCVSGGAEREGLNQIIMAAGLNEVSLLSPRNTPRSQTYLSRHSLTRVLDRVPPHQASVGLATSG